MKKLSTGLALASVAIFLAGAFVLATAKKASASGSAPRILLVGDSTVATAKTNGTQRGWGQIIPEFFGGGVVISNAAVSGTSSKTFITNGYWSNALAFQPDYVFILFGINDANGNTNIGTSPTSETTNSYRNYLRQYVQDCVAAGATPIFVTTYPPRNFVNNVLYTNNIWKYPDAMRVVAAETNISTNIPLIDLYAKTTAFYSQIGQAECDRLNATTNDRTHFNEPAARTMARFIADAVRTNPKLAALAPFVTVPDAASSLPQDLAPGFDGGNLTLSFVPMEGVKHQLQVSSNLSAWTNSGASFFGYGLQITNAIPSPPQSGSNFFGRVKVEP